MTRARPANPLLEPTTRPLPRRVAVIGAGTIGPDIGYYLKAALPGLELVLLDVRQEAVDAAVRNGALAETIDVQVEVDARRNLVRAVAAGKPFFRGLYEDNDPRKRLLMIVNYNTDVSQYWEWSGRGLRPFDETNEAYKLGVNYIIYGLTH